LTHWGISDYIGKNFFAKFKRLREAQINLELNLNTLSRKERSAKYVHRSHKGGNESVTSFPALGETINGKEYEN